MIVVILLNVVTLMNVVILVQIVILVTIVNIVILLKYGETGDSAYSDEFDDSCEYGDSGDSCDCGVSGVSGKSNESGYLANKYMMLCCSKRNKHNLVGYFGFLVIFNSRGMKEVF